MTSSLAEPKAAASQGAVRFSAMSILALREHSLQELRQKLQNRFDDNAMIETVVRQLAEENLQSDERFTEAFISMRMRKGHGPVRIANELRMRGIDQDTAAKYLNTIDDEQWCDLADDVCRRKFRAPAQDHHVKTKQMRFLQYRGFTSDQIRQVWQTR